MLSEEGFDALGAEGIEDFLFYLERKGLEVLHQINAIQPIKGFRYLTFHSIESDGTMIFDEGGHRDQYVYEFPSSYLFNNDWVEEMEEDIRKQKEYQASLLRDREKENKEYNLNTLRELMQKFPDEVLNYKVKLVG